MIKNCIKNSVIIVAILILAACSSTRHGEGDMSSNMEGEGGGAAAGSMDSANTYADEASGSGSGFQPSVSCNVPTAGGVMESYYFDYDKSQVHPEDQSRIRALASRITTGGIGSIKIEGNTDIRGSREYNIALGANRAKTVEVALESYGVPKGKIESSSNGAEKPIAFGQSADDYQCNRRTDVKKVKSENN